ncbi:mucolipin-3-like [Paramacrobiotus metropolitanus]|uniref:mucolipin-3-like n=1 Tax=Paramacrobiotus metropolitanus TaxID=2943436 RepID=UPI002445F003|nr:mucolipin-3-like [Paramacrobiotus metropolitanus]
MGIREDDELLLDLGIPSSSASVPPLSVPVNPFPRNRAHSNPSDRSRIEMLPVIDRGSREDLRDIGPLDDIEGQDQEDDDVRLNQLQLPQELARRRRRSSATSRHLHLVRNNSPAGFPAETVSSPRRELQDVRESQNDVFFGPSGTDARSSLPYVSEQCCTAEADRMKWRIRFFFMDPIQKWKTKHQFPWKLFLQVVKIIFVTIQLVTFGNERYRFATFLKQNTVSFRHLLLENWNDPDIPPAVYPNVVYAVYLREEFYSRIDYAVNNLIDIRDIAVGSYSYTAVNDTALFQFCKREFMQAHVFPENHSYIYDSGIRESCLWIDLMPFQNVTFSVRNYLDEHNASIEFDKLVDARLLLNVKSVALKPNDPDDDPACYIFDVNIKLDNTGHNGQIPVSLDIDPHVVPCNGKILYDDGESVMDILVQVLDFSVLFICMVSFVLCVRALWNAEKLKASVIEFFLEKFNYRLTNDERMDFLNLWYVMIVINDVLILVGTGVKITINNRSVVELPLYNTCGMMLGVGNLLVWFGILRYLGFFRTYNILILTFKRAIPNVLRYLVCILLIFFGFAFCGWIVLGPYHVKFQTFHSTMETIFSLINGDDMFATFAILAYQNSLIWYFSRVYFYFFICIFTYVILSLMISLIMDAYGTVKDYYEQGGPASRLMEFAAEAPSAHPTSCPRHPAFTVPQSPRKGLRGRLTKITEWLRRSRGMGSRSSSDSWIPHQRMEEG